jgi:integrase
MRVVTVRHDSGDLLPILLNEDGLPIPLPSEFLLSRRALSTNTLIRNLRELSIFYGWLKTNGIHLEQRIISGMYFTEAEIIGGMVEFLRRGVIKRNSAVSPQVFNNRLVTVRYFLNWCIDTYIGSLPLTDERYEKFHLEKKRLNEWISQSFINTPSASGILKKSLNEKEVKFLIKCLNPDSNQSFGYYLPVKYRNYVAVSILLNCGLRPGELLSLRVEDVQIGAISSLTVRRRAPDFKDNRKPRPQIKREGRIIVLEGRELVNILNKYILEWREVLEHKSNIDTDYLILSDEGMPLSFSSLTQLFTRLRDTYPDDLPKILTPKSLRHTFSSQMEKTLRAAGLEEESRKQALAKLRGDTSLESQRVYIAQEIEEQARKALALYQKKLIEDN